MISVTIPEAKSRLAELIDQVSAGEEVVILRRGVPIARLMPGTAKARLASHSLTGRSGVPEAAPAAPAVRSVLSVSTTREGDTVLAGLEELGGSPPK